MMAEKMTPAIYTYPKVMSVFRCLIGFQINLWKFGQWSKNKNFKIKNSSTRLWNENISLENIYVILRCFLQSDWLSVG